MSATPIRERTSWLLRVNRRLAGDPRLRAGKEFAAAFRDAGERPLAPSQVTRWEDGTVLPRRETIRRYEDLLGLAPHALTSLKDAVDRAAGLTQPALPAGVVPDQRRFHELLERATTGGSMTGQRWGELSELVQACPGLVLHPPGLWERVSHRLLDELVVAEDTAWLLRQEAMSRLLEHPDAGAHAVDACISLAADRSSPVVVEPLSLLDASALPDANRHICRTIAAADDGRALYGALLASVRKVRVGHFTPDQLGRLGASMTGLLDDSALSASLRPLIDEVGRTMNGGAEAERVPVPRVQPVPHRAAVMASAELLPGHGTDPILAGLVDDALHNANPDERMHAAMFIAGTPYAPVVARTLVEDLVTDLRRRSEAGLAPALRTLTILGSTDHRVLIAQILTGNGFSEAARHAAAWATPHCAGRYDEAIWRRILQVQFQAWRRMPLGLGEEILYAVTYGMGTDGHRTLLAEVRADDRLPARSRAAAAWLLTAPEVIRSGH
ncbi:hypothetical protein [Actinoplanes sp. NPDC049265]|uniref:hypothetical protein n=1 Tax=Actinoplanes sp. NPDC049265 TaxID=3363902 RepID=UPI003711D522